MQPNKSSHTSLFSPFLRCPLFATNPICWIALARAPFSESCSSSSRSAFEPQLAHNFVPKENVHPGHGLNWSATKIHSHYFIWLEVYCHQYVLSQVRLAAAYSLMSCLPFPCELCQHICLAPVAHIHRCNQIYACFQA